MRTPPFVIAFALVIAACSAESAPDNAAGSIKQAPVDIEKTQAIGDLTPGDAEAEEGKGGKKKKVPNSNGPRCGQVEEEICPDASQQKLCSCSSGPGNQGATYKCGCKSGSAGGGIEAKEMLGAEG